MNNYREVISNLSAEKEKMAQSFEEMRRELSVAGSPATRARPRSILEQLPTSPAGSTFSPASAGNAGRPIGSPVNSMLMGLAPAGSARRELGTSPTQSAAPSALLASIAGLGTAGSAHQPGVGSPSSSHGRLSPAGSPSMHVMKAAGSAASPSGRPQVVENGGASLRKRSSMVAPACPNCSFIMTDDAAFCTKCGTRRPQMKELQHSVEVQVGGPGQRPVPSNSWQTGAVL